MNYKTLTVKFVLSFMRHLFIIILVDLKESLHTCFSVLISEEDYEDKV